jgi:hypothetical protein
MTKIAMLITQLISISSINVSGGGGSGGGGGGGGWLWRRRRQKSAILSTTHILLKVLMLKYETLIKGNEGACDIHSTHRAAASFHTIETLLMSGRKRSTLCINVKTNKKIY